MENIKNLNLDDNSKKEKNNKFNEEIKGNLTERISNNNQNQNIMNNKHSINKNKIPKTHREMLPKKNKMLIKEINISEQKKILRQKNNINNNYGYVKERIKKENIIYKKNKNITKKNPSNLTSNKNGITTNSQRPNSSRANTNKISITNNLVDKIVNNNTNNNNNKYIEFQSHPIKINMNQGYSKQINNKKIYANQGTNFGPYIKIVGTKKGFQ